MSPDAGQSARGHLLCRYSVLKNGQNLPECVQIIHKGVIMSGTIFSLIPPIVAIALALITKEVYLSLLIGIMSGAFLFTGPNPLHAVETMIAIMGEKIGAMSTFCFPGISRHRGSTDHKVWCVEGLW